MDDRNTLIFCLVGGCLCMATVVWWLWRRAAITVGLPFCYLFSLAMIHFVGAGVHILPWNELQDTHFVALGFKECFFGVLAFTIGVLVVDWLLKSRSPAGLAEPLGGEDGEQRVSGRAGRGRSRRREAAKLGPPSPVGGYISNNADPVVARSSPASGSRPHLPRFYMLSGLACVVILIPILHNIPSIGAVANCGSYLVVGGLCLVCWWHWRQQDQVRMLAWAATSLVFPAFTMLTEGFLGFGVYAALMLLVFISSFYRPRWHLVLGWGVLLYFGLCVFVTYMRDRSDFRDSVWGGEQYRARFEKFYTMFSQFECFDPHDGRHLEVIDDRLNQNSAVGLTVDNLQSGAVPFANGYTIYSAMWAVVPRIIWPDKPVFAGSPLIVSFYTGMTFAEGTSVGVGQVMEFYINFGRWGILGGFFVFGLIIRWLDWKAANCLRRGDESGFIRWYLPALAFMAVGGSLVEVVGTFAASTLLVVGTNYYLRATQPMARNLINKTDSESRLPKSLPSGGAGPAGPVISPKIV